MNDDQNDLLRLLKAFVWGGHDLTSLEAGKELRKRYGVEPFKVFEEVNTLLQRKAMTAKRRKK